MGNAHVLNLSNKFILTKSAIILLKGRLCVICIFLGVLFNSVEFLEILLIDKLVTTFCKCDKGLELAFSEP